MKVLVGMSGGVDSSVAASMLCDQGYEVIGITLRLYDYSESLQETVDQKKDCHPDLFIEDAAAVAKKLGIEHHVIDRRDLFKKTIIDSFRSDYEKGKTPLPCITCNRDVKTSALYDLMTHFGAERLATGHYVRDMTIDHVVQLHQGSDPIRDQSFFLFALTFDQLQKLIFPLGHFSKDQTRAYAKEKGLCVFSKTASQDLCFISKKDYRQFFSGSETVSGPIRDITGKIWGQHNGIRGYTIGQRQGIGVGGFDKPMYVTAIDRERNEIIIGPREELARNTIILERVNWLLPVSASSFQQSYSFLVKLRSAGRPHPAQVIPDDKGGAVVLLENAEYGVAPGQVCVFYEGTRLVGGGWIQSASLRHANDEAGVA
jgi:tRNA-uridine 2-sulfurtransferase